MARTGMTTIITTLRGMTNAANDQTTVNGLPFWSDDDIQRVLDRNRTDLIHVTMGEEPQYSGGTVVYKRFWSPLANLEQTTGGTAVFVIEDGYGSIAGTANYTVDYTRGLVTFAADQGGTLWYLTANAYDINRSAAEVWRMKAAQVAETSFNFSTDNHSVSRNQIIQNCMMMAEMYDQQGGAQTVRTDRTDTNAY